jgi:hypothetical protein
MLSTTQLFDLFLRRIIIAMFPYARIVELKKKGESWELCERITKFSIFFILFPIAVVMQWHVLLCFLSIILIVFTFLTTASDKLGLKLTKIFHKCLRSLTTLVTELVQVIESFKTHFQSAILPIELPPPRASR